MLCLPVAARHGWLAGRVFVSLALAGGLALGLVLPLPSANAFELANLNGANGFVIVGIEEGDQSGFPVTSAGDLNADGINDMVVGASLAGPNGVQAGSAYVLFGANGVGRDGIIDLSALDGTDGFALNGAVIADRTGGSVAAAGDLNNDGIGDLVISASGADPNEDNSGATYVVFGKADIGAAGAIELAALDGSDGFVINGTALLEPIEPPSGDPLEDRTPPSGPVAGPGDLNGDGIDDLLIGAPRVDVGGPRTGAAYIVFGKPGLGSSGSIEVTDLDGSTGLILTGLAEEDRFGGAVSGLGDINGDGVSDMAFGAPGANTFAGITYVLFGGTWIDGLGTFNPASLDGTNGFVMNGTNLDDRSGVSIAAAGDVNQDGIDDFLVGAYRADPSGDLSGQSYLIFGAPGIGAGGTFDYVSLDGSNGVNINGATMGDVSGLWVSGPGDINGDGAPEVMIGSRWADPNGDKSGATHVIYGRANLGATGNIGLGFLDELSGMVLNGVAAGDRAGRTHDGIGDVNNDGIADFAIGAWNASPLGVQTGATYVVFGVRDAVFNAMSPSDNLLSELRWQDAAAMAATDVQFDVEFETGFNDGQNLSGDTSTLPGGLVIYSADDSAIVRVGAGVVEGSNPIGSFALTHSEAALMVLNFQARPVDYVSVHDIDQPGMTVLVEYNDGTSRSHDVDETESIDDSAEFFGATRRGDGTRIERVTFAVEGTGTWAIDNLSYGRFPQGAAVRKLDLNVAACVNRDSGASNVYQTAEGVNSFDCETAGVAVERGDAVLTAQQGFVDLSGNDDDDLVFDSSTPGEDLLTYLRWLEAVGIYADELQYQVDFRDGFANGQNISGDGNALSGGLIIWSEDNSAVVKAGLGAVEGSDPLDGYALTHTQGAAMVFDFSDSPVDYVAFKDIDHSGISMAVLLNDGTTENVQVNATAEGGASAEFLGIAAQNGVRVSSVRLQTTGPGQWGIDNLKYGRVTLGGRLRQLSISRTICTNFNTGVSVLAVVGSGGRSWDCEAAGLEVEQGHQVFFGQPGQAD